MLCSWVNFSVWIAIPHEFHEWPLVVFARLLSGQHVGEWCGCSLSSPAFEFLLWICYFCWEFSTVTLVCESLHASLVLLCAGWDAYWCVSLCVLLKHLDKSFIHFYWLEERWAPCVVFNQQAICQITCFAGIYFQPFYPAFTHFFCLLCFVWLVFETG